MVLETDVVPTEQAPADAETPEPSKQDQELIRRIQRTIRADKLHHADAFKAMRRDMSVARNGHLPEYPKTNYKANISGRHVKAKTAALYAKNPRVIAKRRDTMDFVIWDENPATLQLAMQTMQQAAAAAAQPAAVVDEATGMAVPAPPPEMPPGFDEAQALLTDFQEGMQRRQVLTRYAKTLEILFGYFMREQKPLDFKMALKRVVRRTCTTGVGYVELGFQRETGPRPGISEQLADARQRLDHIQRLIDEQSEDVDPDDAEIAELEHSIAALQAEPEIVLREGLVFDYPQSTRVIPDKMCRSLVGFVGARHLTVEYIFTVDEVKELFPAAELGKDYTSYRADAKTGEVAGEASAANTVRDDADSDIDATPTTDKGSGLVCVWKHYDKPSGLVYYVADGCKRFLRPPAAPDVFVEDFWPVYALTFNEVESETELFPPSDVHLMSDMQAEYNRSRQGLREHRRAARPRWGFAKGSLSVEDIEGLKTAEAFSVTPFDKDPQTKLADVLEVIPVPGVDPNLYETGPIFSDTQLVVGSAEAQFGGTSKATATESALAAGTTQSSDQASIDDLDGFLSVIARAGGQILQREMSAEQVQKIVGRGALWPDVSLADIAGEIFLEVEAGSTGRPNQAVEINNFKELAPLLMQIPNVDPVWLAREGIKRMDDRVDLADAISSALPAIVAQNRMTQPATGNAATDPTQQGDAGANNAPMPPAQGGSSAAFGSNQV